MTLASSLIGLLPPYQDFLHVGNGLFLSLEEEILENQLILLEPSSLQDSIPQNPSKQIHELARVCPPEAQGCDPPVCLVLFSQDPELHHLIVTASKAAPDLHILYCFFLVCKCKFSIKPHLVGQMTA